MVIIGNDWDDLLKEEFQKDYYLKLRKFLINEYKTKTIYPNMHDIYCALKLTSYKDCKILILGQDPYHAPSQAHGLAFSVSPGIKSPPSLVNIYQELKNEYGYPIPNNGYLTPWAHQGILLLNTALTVRKSEPNSHSNVGWEIFTDNIIKKLNERDEPVIFLLWGANARKKTEFINKNKHYILEAPHPSPYSADRGFFGCNHFKKVNEILNNLGKTEINWKIEDI